MELLQTALPGCYEIKPQIFRDGRGSFVKTFHDETFIGMGLRIDWREEYYSVSKRGVIRGMHFQIPPMQHAKMVYCLLGVVQDVILDLRIGSPSYGKCISIELSAEKSNVVYIPEGAAHGFCALTDQVIMQYKVTSTYAHQQDTGICWDSIPVSWQVNKPIVSDRDSNLVKWQDFQSPFRY